MAEGVGARRALFRKYPRDFVAILEQLEKSGTRSQAVGRRPDVENVVD
jgi:hypothetical protein